MSKFQVGQRVVRTSYRFGDFEEGKPYTVSEVDYTCENPVLKLKEKGPYWYDATCFELYQEPAQKTFNPKSGDIIVTNNGVKYKCMSREEYCRFGGFSTNYYKDYAIFGWDITAIDPQYFHHMRWLSADGKASCDHDFDIKEIIPASKVLAKVEKTYGVSTTADSQEWVKQKSINPVRTPQQPQDLSFQVKALELENQMLRKLLRREGVEV